MACYNFKCKECGTVRELVQPMANKLPDWLKCPKCGARAELVWQGAPAVLRGGSANASVDVVVGRDADARWADINKRQELRNKVRKDKSSLGLTATGRNEFQPLSEKQKQTRAEFDKKVKKEGTVPVFERGELPLMRKPQR